MDNMEIEEQMTNMVNATAVSVLLTNIGNSTSVIADTTDSTITAVTQSQLMRKLIREEQKLRMSTEDHDKEFASFHMFIDGDNYAPFIPPKNKRIMRA